MKKSVLLIILIGLSLVIAGCGNSPSGEVVKEINNYVCPDGSVVDSPEKCESSEEKQDSLAIPKEEAETDLEISYLKSVTDISKRATKTFRSITSTSIKSSQGDISMSQALELFIIYESQMEEYVRELNSLQAPSRYSPIHIHYKKAFSLSREAMELMVIGIKNEDADIMFQAVDKLNEGTTEINTATELMNAIN